MASKRSVSYHRVVRAMSLCCLSGVLTGLSAASASACLLTGCAMLCMLPLSDEEDWVSAAFAVPAALALCAVLVLGLPMPVLSLSLPVLMLSYLTVQLRHRYRRIRPLFSSLAVWYSVEGHARLIYSLMTAFLCTAASVTGQVRLMEWPCLVLSACCHVLLQLRAHLGRTMIMSVSREKKIKSMIAMNLRDAPRVQPETLSGMENLKTLYARTVKLMETGKVYLDPDLKIAGLASMLYTNRSSLSKAINIVSGNHFKEFVNHYRVLHAQELMRQNPDMALSVIARSSGFSSNSSFCGVFKLKTGKTPSEYAQEIRIDARLLPSMKTEQVRKPPSLPS